MGIRLLIITPEQTMLDETVESVSLPGTRAPFQVLQGHAPLISSLTKGKVKYVLDGEVHEVEIVSGFVEVGNNTVSVCVEL